MTNWSGYTRDNPFFHPRRTGRSACATKAVPSMQTGPIWGIAMRRARCGMIVAAAVLFAGALLVRPAATDGSPRAAAQKFCDAAAQFVFGGAGGLIKAPSQCSSAFPPTKRHMSNHVVVYFFDGSRGSGYSRGRTTIT